MCWEKDFINLYIKHSNILYREQAIFLNIYKTPNIKAWNVLYRHVRQSPWPECLPSKLNMHQESEHAYTTKAFQLSSWKFLLRHKPIQGDSWSKENSDLLGITAPMNNLLVS